jgi:hypothetical protein
MADDETRVAVCRCSARLVPLSWKLLAALRGPEGKPALGGVEDTQGRLLRGVAAVRELQTRMGARRVVLLGDTRAGKSVSLAAGLDGELREGAERARWANAISLREPGAIDRALGAKTLFLDDVGEELFGAGENTGLAAQRCAPVCEFVGALARVRGKRLRVSTPMDFDRMSRFYGGNVAARIYEGADVIRVVRR